MIGVSSPLPAPCVSCGGDLTDADVNDDGACAECFGESRAKAAAQLEKERADQFRWLSAEWFAKSHLCRMPFNSRSERYYTRAA